MLSYGRRGNYYDDSLENMGNKDSFIWYDLAGVPYPGTSFRGREVASEHWGSKDFDITPSEQLSEVARPFSMCPLALK
ncbi:unnamed protein product [Penicillium camemberti]|uniref:Str. FM013 n=1 Tax=Penicillium camemberti (strain FM 013) TaxID=1429867 RepID=A0A0G4PM67_PENC3|nr:unnamed protein product [Penicillium camemberti]